MRINGTRFVRKTAFQFCFAFGLDTVLYLNYPGSVVRMITDDQKVHVNTVQKQEKETEREYFIRKLRAIRGIVSGKRAVLVIDNYCSGDEEDFELLRDVEEMASSRGNPS